MGRVLYEVEDHNLEPIHIENACLDVASYLLTREYYVVGLKQEARPPLLIRLNERAEGVDGLRARVHGIATWLSTSGIQTVVLESRGRADVTICLRRDVREFIPFSASLVRAVIYGIEDMIDFATSPPSIPAPSTFARFDADFKVCPCGCGVIGGTPEELAHIVAAGVTIAASRRRRQQREEQGGESEEHDFDFDSDIDGDNEEERNA